MSHNFQALLLHSIQLMEDALPSTSIVETRTGSPKDNSDANTTTAKSLSAMHALPFCMRFVGTLLQHVYDTGCSSSTLKALFRMSETQEQQLQALQDQQTQQSQRTGRLPLQQQEQLGGGGNGSGGGPPEILHQRFWV